MIPSTTNPWSAPSWAWKINAKTSSADRRKRAKQQLLLQILVNGSSLLWVNSSLQPIHSRAVARPVGRRYWDYRNVFACFLFIFKLALRQCYGAGGYIIKLPTGAGTIIRNYVSLLFYRRLEKLLQIESHCKYFYQTYASVHVRRYLTQVKEGNFQGNLYNKTIHHLKINPKAAKMFV